MRYYFKDAELNKFADRLEGMGSLQIGDTVRGDHDECGDTRARGYITRKNGADGRVVDLFYCHNCGASDVRMPAGTHIPVTALPREAPREKPAEEPVTLPYDAGVVSFMPDIPPHIVSWAMEYGVADKVLWSPTMERIIMPVCDFGSGALLGYQARRDPAGSTRIPKYLTVASREKPLRLLVCPDAPYLRDEPNTVVIVEDWVSAHQFRNLPGVWGAALLGLNASAEHLLWIDKTVKEYTDHHPRYVIWLDNDVKKSFEVRDYLQRLMMSIGRRSHVVGHLKDPKNTTESVLSATVEHAFT